MRARFESPRRRDAFANTRDARAPPDHPARLFLLVRFLRPRLETREFFQERELHVADRAVALLGDDERGLSLGGLFVLLGVGIVLLADEQPDEVGVLLDAAGFAQKLSRVLVAEPKALDEFTFSLRDLLSAQQLSFLN